MRALITVLVLFAASTAMAASLTEDELRTVSNTASELQEDCAFGYKRACQELKDLDAAMKSEGYTHASDGSYQRKSVQNFLNTFAAN